MNGYQCMELLHPKILPAKSCTQHCCPAAADRPSPSEHRNLAINWKKHYTELFLTSSLYMMSHYLVYSDCLRRESNFFGFNVPGHCLVHKSLLHCMPVRLLNGYMRAYAQIMQHMHTHKAVTGCVEAKKLLSHWRQSNYTCHQCSLFDPVFFTCSY